MKIFEGLSLIEFQKLFKSDLDCKQYLWNIKWENDFLCRKCKHTKATKRKDFAMQCTRCKDIETSSAGTLFHKVKFGLLKAFYIAFEMSTTTKGLSASQVQKRYDISYPTALNYMKKVRLAMQSSKQYPMDGNVEVDEFVIGGKENLKQGRSNDSKKHKVVMAIQFSINKGVKRVYCKQISDFSSKSIKPIFEEHIDKQANITTDGWRAYMKISRTTDFKISQENSDGKNFIQLHNIVHQIKTWIRTTFSNVSSKHVQKYLDEYCYRINRSIYRNTIFHNLIKRMALAKPVTYKEILNGST